MLSRVMTTLIGLKSKGNGGDKSITLSQLFKRNDNAHSSSITKSDGYAFLEHHVLELNDFTLKGGADNHLASCPIPFVLAIDLTTGGNL